MSTAVLPHSVLATVPTGLYIDGEWQPAADGRTFAVENPATGETLVEVADGTPDDGRAHWTPRSGRRSRGRGPLLASAVNCCAERSSS
jgi:succinate-semialdehyde dehydrogenase/glutarate-semialdehyde dehydrogenase